MPDEGPQGGVCEELLVLWGGVCEVEDGFGGFWRRAAEALVLERVEGGVENSGARGGVGGVYFGWVDCLEVAEDVSGVVESRGVRLGVLGVLFAHVVDVFAGNHILNPKVAVGFVAASHLFDRGVIWGRFEPADYVGVDVATVVCAELGSIGG